jgi:7-cyano-7-deazaguanine synthase
VLATPKAFASRELSKFVPAECRDQVRRGDRSPGEMSRAVVLLSGGLDSATTLAVAIRDGFDAYALSFGYGQRHNLELEAARRVGAALGAREHRIAKIDLRVFGGSALTDEIAVPKNRTAKEASAIPITYVPARNTIFLSYALAWCEVLGAADIFIGANAIDYSGYPDCRPEFISAFERLANLATKAGVEGTHFHIHAPLISMTKAEIIRKGAELGVDFALTHSCYDPAEDGCACGECDSCRLRLEGFRAAGLVDPIRYANR